MQEKKEIFEEINTIFEEKNENLEEKKNLEKKEENFKGKNEIFEGKNGFFEGKTEEKNAIFEGDKFFNEFAVFLDKYSFEIDKKSAFLTGFLIGKLEKKHGEIEEVFDLLNKEGNFVMKKPIKRIQEEEEKEFILEKTQKNQGKNRSFGLYSRLKRFVFEGKSNKIPEKTLCFKENSIEKSIEKSVISKENEILCNICLSDLMKEPIHLMDSCPHVFHIDCLKEYLITEVFSPGFSFIISLIFR